MPIYKNEVGYIGSLIYVWSQREGKPSRGVTEAVISAHGGTSQINGMRNAPRCNLAFYGPHGHILSALRLRDVVNGRAKSLETIDSRASQDYRLSKYTNTDLNVTKEREHNEEKETYADLEGMEGAFRREAEANTRIVNELTLKQTNRGALSTPELKMLDFSQRMASANEEVNRDMITIRSRKRFTKSPLLSVVLRELWNHGYKYETIHCSFCRGGGKTYKMRAEIDF